MTRLSGPPVRRWPLFLILTALSALASPDDVRAQAVTVDVRVVSDGQAVEGAQVVSGSTGGITDAAGVLELTLHAGEHRLVVTRIGYAEAERTIVLVAGQDTTVLIELEEEAVHGEEILVISTRTERRIEDEPLRVEVVSREEVEEKLLMTPGDIGMLLNETAGLRVQPTAPSLGGASVRIQGLRGRYTQILSDGLPLYGGQTGALGPLQIPPMDLGQVEVIKGAASALYGATAMGGIVNLISRRPENERGFLLNQSTLGGTDGVLWLAGDRHADLAAFLTSLVQAREACAQALLSLLRDGDGPAGLAVTALAQGRARGRPMLVVPSGLNENPSHVSIAGFRDRT